MTRQQLRAWSPWIGAGALQALLIGLRLSGAMRWPWWLTLIPLIVVALICGLMLGSLAMWAGVDHEKP